MWRAKFGTHIWKKFNRPNRESRFLLVWGLGGLCQGSKSLSWDYCFKSLSGFCGQDILSLGYYLRGIFKKDLRGLGMVSGY